MEDASINQREHICAWCGSQDKQQVIKSVSRGHLRIYQVRWRFIFLFFIFLEHIKRDDHRAHSLNISFRVWTVGCRSCVSLYPKNSQSSVSCYSAGHRGNLLFTRPLVFPAGLLQTRCQIIVSSVGKTSGLAVSPKGPVWLNGPRCVAGLVWSSLLPNIRVNVCSSSRILWEC